MSVYLFGSLGFSNLTTTSGCESMVENLLKMLFIFFLSVFSVRINRQNASDMHAIMIGGIVEAKADFFLNGVELSLFDLTQN